LTRDHLKREAKVKVEVKGEGWRLEQVEKDEVEQQGGGRG